MSTTRARVDNPLTMSTTRARVGNPLTVSTTRAHARARRMPQSGLGLQLGEIMPPAAWGIPSEGGEHHGMPRMPPCPGDALFFVAVGGTKRKMPPRVWGLPVPAPRQGNARTRQGWPSLCTFASRRPRERPHAPGLAGPGGRRGRPGGGTPARARAGPRSGFPQVVRHPWGYAHKNPDLQNTHRAQGGDPALVRGPVFPNSLPCVRH